MQRKVIYFILSLTVLSLAEGSCILNFSSNKIERPKIIRHLGSKRIPVPYDNSKITLFKDEVIDAYCGTTLVDHSSNSQIFNCAGSELEYPGYYDYGYYRQRFTDIKCKLPELKLYESLSPFDWCNKTDKFGSYGLVVSNNLEEPIIAEICYNYESQTPQIVQYYTVPTVYMDHNNLTMIDNLFDYDVSKISVPYENQNSLKEVDFKLNMQYFSDKEDFEYSNLVQNGVLFDFERQNQIISVAWWHNLRISNWKRYLDALDEQSEKEHIYKIYAGTGGNMTVPGEYYESDTKTIPAYIWNIVQEVNGTEEFVIMGYNSPYYEMFEQDKTICKDICEDINWLDGVSDYFKYAHFGRMFCCSLKDALATGMLEGLTL